MTKSNGREITSPIELSDDVSFELKTLIANFTGKSADQITMNADLERDLGITGDDAVQVFTEIDQKYKIDWGDLDLNVHFGPEGFGMPLPWVLKSSGAFYERVPCRVGDLVATIQSGKWIGTPRRDKSGIARGAIIAMSWAQFVMFMAIPLLAILYWLWKAIR